VLANTCAACLHPNRQSFAYSPLASVEKKGKLSTFFVVCDVTASREDLDDKFELTFFVSEIVLNPMMGHFSPVGKRKAHWLLQQNEYKLVYSGAICHAWQAFYPIGRLKCCRRCRLPPPQGVAPSGNRSSMLLVFFTPFQMQRCMRRRIQTPRRLRWGPMQR